jgi:tetratricopeptide (TPR) repeat protein
MNESGIHHLIKFCPFDGFSCHLLRSPLHLQSMKRALTFHVVACCLSVGLIKAQVLPQAQPGGGQPASNVDTSPQQQPQKKEQLLGGAIPFMDPGSETVSMDGKMFNATNNRLFRARVEKYLAAPEANTPEDETYRAVLDEIAKVLMPTHNGGKPDLPAAVALLPIAAQHKIDAKLCDSLANAIYGVWLSQKNVANLRQTNVAMKQQVNTMHFFGEHSTSPLSQRSAQSTGGKGGTANSSQGGAQQAKQLGTVVQYVKDIAELEAKMKANELATGVASLTAKAEFQALILQFLLQRRFEHVVMACRFYRHIFSDPNGVLQLKEGSDAEKMFATSLGTSPTIGAVDSFANEAMRDVDEAVQAFDNLLERGDMASASQRITEAFMMGEYLPRVRRVPSKQKLRVLDFTRDGNQLISAMEMKDYTLAESLVTKMRTEAKDFDGSKPTAVIETARTVAEMNLNKAKVSAMQGDQKSSTEALKAAAEIWPTNPKLKEFTKMIGSNADVKTQAVLDLDRLVSQRNYRQIYNDQGRYLAAITDDPTRQEQLKTVLTDVNKMNLIISGATQLSQSGNTAGAWETIERAFKDFPDDPEITRMRSDLTVKATNFVDALQHGKQHEDRQQIGSALAWYLKARSQYPPSEFAREGIARMLEKLHGGNASTASASASGAQ